MAWGLRIYLFNEDGKVSRIPYTMYNKLRDNKYTIPKYAGKSIKAVFVSVDIENRKPISITDYHGVIFYFDENGSAIESIHQLHTIAVRSIPSFKIDLGEKPSNVIDITGKIELRKLKNKYTWEPTSSDLDRIAKAIWPEK